MRARTWLAIGTSLPLAACAALLSLPDRTLDPGLDAATDASSNDGNTSLDSGDAAATPCDGGIVCGAAGCVDITSSAAHCGACDRDCLGGGCNRGQCTPVRVVDALDTPVGLAVSNDAIYVAVNGANQVLRIDKRDGGGAIVTFDAGVSSPWGLALDDAGARLAVGESRGGGNARVHVCDPASCATTTSTAADDEQVRHLAISGATLYWADNSGGTGQKIRKCTLASCGSTAADVRTGENNAFGVVLIGGELYWTIRNGTGKVRHCTAGNCAAPVDLASGSPYANAEGIATDGTNLYWANNNSDTISTCVATACAPVTFAPASEPHFVLVDQGRVYWSNGITSTAGSLQWCPASGCGDAGVHTLAEGQVNPLWIAADKDAIYWTNSTATGQVMKVRKPQ